jgi:hypothetical protein
MYHISQLLKNKIIQEVTEIGSCTVSRKYGTGENCIRYWRKKKELTLQSNGSSTAFHHQKVKYLEIQ